MCGTISLVAIKRWDGGKDLRELYEENSAIIIISSSCACVCRAVYAYNLGRSFSFLSPSLPLSCISFFKNLSFVWVTWKYFQFDYTAPSTTRVLFSTWCSGNNPRWSNHVKQIYFGPPAPLRSLSDTEKQKEFSQKRKQLKLFFFFISSFLLRRAGQGTAGVWALRQLIYFTALFTAVFGRTSRYRLDFITFIVIIY